MSIKSLQTTSTARCNARTGVLFPGALGDFICFLPALRLLARDHKVDLFAQSQFTEIAPEGVNVQSLERPEIARLFVADSVADENLKSFFGDYEAIYSWFGTSNEGFAARLRALASGQVRFFPFRPANPQGHQADYYFSCLSQGGLLSNRMTEPSIVLGRDAMRWCEDFWIDHSLDRRPVMAIAPGSGAREKNWPEEFFPSVAQWWNTAVGGVVVLLVGPVEKERGLSDLLGRRCLVAEDLRLRQVAALVSRCTVYLGNDSGMSHLAAALGVRTIAVFGPTDAHQWAPRGEKVTVVQRNISCSPCQEATMKSCPHRACLGEIYPGRIIDILAAFPEVVTLTRHGAGIRV